MAESITPTNSQTTTVTTTKVTCHGPATSRHPMVTLSLPTNAHGHPTHVVCPYCSHVFVYKAA
ncbi:MAG: hypothetical protein WAZ18_05155 [Alphaproteobacteria bacterium]